ncbi:MAG TPA: hypothetical protein VER17_03905 [Tepidisphaeraceae bacterium]|nr:hypothetical protein [Tepidisphaeraceae bacterium]
MLDHVTFQTALFDDELHEPDVDSGMEPTGRELAGWLKERLSEVPGLRLDEPIAEDWGWCLRVGTQGVDLYVGCHCDGDAEGDPVPPRWLAFVFCDWEPFKRFFHRPVDGAKQALARSLHEALRSCDAVCNVRWYEKSQIDAGDRRQGKEQPD